jgi:hypothetical protein
LLTHSESRPHQDAQAPYAHGLCVWFTNIVGRSVYRHCMTPQKREDDLKKDQPLEGFYDGGKHTLLQGREVIHATRGQLNSTRDNLIPLCWLLSISVLKKSGNDGSTGIGVKLSPSKPHQEADGKCWGALCVQE